MKAGTAYLAANLAQSRHLREQLPSFKRRVATVDTGPAEHAVNSRVAAIWQSPMSLPHSRPGEPNPQS